MVENKYYERKIKYLDLMQNGERTGGAGFIKTEVQGMDISLTVTVKGLHPTDTYERDVMLRAGDEEFVIGRICLKEGQGEFKYHTVMDHSRLQGIRIVLGGTREICCRWKEDRSLSRMWGNVVKEGAARQDDAKEDGMRWDAARENVAAEGAAKEDGMGRDTAKEESMGRDAASENIAAEGVVWEKGQQDHKTAGRTAEDLKEEKQRRGRKSQEIQLIPWDEIKVVEESLEKVEKIMSKPVGNNSWKAAEGEVGNRVSERAAREVTEKERTTRGVTERDRATRERRTAADGSVRQEKRPVRLMEDKWQQIWAIYPHIRPFQDEREYLSISPADFVLLPNEAYRAANNSFLLHGYYNYDHLILTKIERRGEVLYYIGVPGNYYEREKQVAIMFGFESFECGTEPAQAGDFGYYMMRTQL